MTNEFRQKVLGSEPLREPLLRGKTPKSKLAGEREDGIADVTIPRLESRSTDHRSGDRHRLGEEEALLTHGGESRPVALINLSGGGAMIEGAHGLKLWDRVDLQCGECDPLEAIARWIRGERVGLEFAHETRLQIPAEERQAMLRAVIRRSFSDVIFEAEAMDEAAAAQPAATAAGPVATPLDEREPRHPLIWSGLVHYCHESIPVRLRNISTGGALVEGAAMLRVGAELLLDLDEAGAIFGTVHWARGDQAGIRFHVPFDVHALVRSRPKVAEARWVAPDYLRDDLSYDSPWSSRWDRSDLGRLHRALEPRPSRRPD